MIKFVSYNIRCDYEQDGVNNFSFRKPLLLKKIEEEKPDIICFQEVLPHVACWLKDNLKEYDLVGCPRSAEFEDEQETIAYRRDRFNLIGLETFWLSETPDVPGSRYKEQSICPRVTTEALLHDLADRNSYRVVNTHLDHEGTEARRLGLAQIMRKITNPKGFAAAPVILAGDFNAEPSMPEMKVMEEYPQFEDASKSLPGTFHDYGIIGNPVKIDYIFLSRPLKCRKAELWMDCENGVYLSDHYPVSVEIYSE